MKPIDVLETPVLLLTFNRPDTTRQVLEAIREARPTRLFVASDGPRTQVASDTRKVAATRALVDEIVDWPCRVERRYSESNQGCRVGVSSAITWFFENVEEGIILEDDCLPHQDFFPYCHELLRRYRSDARVMSIGGSNTVSLALTSPTESYCFSRQPLIWGWATWRRAWNAYDGELTAWRRIRDDSKRKRAIWPDRLERTWQARTLDRLLLDGKPDTWDYQWSFSLAVHDGLSIIPAVNLVSNIGFNGDATHTLTKDHPWANVPTGAILPLTHPEAVEPDEGVDRQIFDRIHGGSRLRKPTRRLLAMLRSLARIAARRTRRDRR